MPLFSVLGLGDDMSVSIYKLQITFFRGMCSLFLSVVDLILEHLLPKIIILNWQQLTLILLCLEDHNMKQISAYFVWPINIRNLVTSEYILTWVKMFFFQVYRFSVIVHLVGCHSVNHRCIFMTIKGLRKVQRKVRTCNII